MWHQGSDSRIREGEGWSDWKPQPQAGHLNNIHGVTEITELGVPLRDAAKTSAGKPDRWRPGGVHSGVSQGTRELSCFDSHLTDVTSLQILVSCLWNM